MVKELDRKISEHGLESHAIHSGPIIRNEGYYQKYSTYERKRLFNDLLFFTKKVNIKYHTVTVDKRQFPTQNQLVDRLSK